MTSADRVPVDWAPTNRWSAEKKLVVSAVMLTAALLAFRLLVIGRFGLFFDEAYYWLWSTDLAAGYFDHPPAVAFAIRAGTALFGDTEFGVRFIGAIVLVPIAALTFGITRIIVGSTKAAAWAAIFANLTSIAAFTVITVPDELQIAFWLGASLALATIAKGGRPGWWLLVGLMYGLSAQSKYTAFLLAAGSALWIVCVPSLRPWLRRPWPYAAVVIAFLVLSPNLLWNAAHGWPEVVVQAQQSDLDSSSAISLATYLLLIPLVVSPILFVLALLGIKATLARGWRLDPFAAYLILPLLPIAIYLAYHSLVDEIEFHWLSPFAFWGCILAAIPAASPSRPRVRLLRNLALASGLAVTVVFYLVLARPFGTLPASINFAARFEGWPEFTRNVDQLRVAEGADYIIGDRYFYPAYFKFYLPNTPPVFQLRNPAIDGAFGMWSRWDGFPAADPSLASSSAIFVGKWGRDAMADVASLYFQNVQYIGEVYRPTGSTRETEYAFLVRDPLPAAAPLFNNWQ